MDSKAQAGSHRSILRRSTNGCEDLKGLMSVVYVYRAPLSVNCHDRPCSRLVADLMRVFWEEFYRLFFGLFIGIDRNDEGFHGGSSMSDMCNVMERAIANQTLHSPVANSVYPGFGQHTIIIIGVFSQSTWFS